MIKPNYNIELEARRQANAEQKEKSDARLNYEIAANKEAEKEIKQERDEAFRRFKRDAISSSGFIPPVEYFCSKEVASMMLRDALNNVVKEQDNG